MNVSSQCHPGIPEREVGLAVVIGAGQEEFRCCRCESGRHARWVCGSPRSLTKSRVAVEVGNFKIATRSSLMEQCFRETAGSPTSTWLGRPPP